MPLIMVISTESVEKLRSSRPEVFCKKDVLRNFAKFIGKLLCQDLFFNKVSCLRPQVFSCEFCEFSKNIFFHRTPLVTASVSVFPTFFPKLFFFLEYTACLIIDFCEMKV